MHFCYHSAKARFFTFFSDRHQAVALRSLVRAANQFVTKTFVVSSSWQKRVLFGGEGGGLRSDGMLLVGCSLPSQSTINRNVLSRTMMSCAAVFLKAYTIHWTGSVSWTLCGYCFAYVKCWTMGAQSSVGGSVRSVMMSHSRDKPRAEPRTRKTTSRARAANRTAKRNPVCDKSNEFECWFHREINLRQHNYIPIPRLERSATLLLRPSI